MDFCIEKYFDDLSEKPIDRIVSDGGCTGIFRRIAIIGDSLSSGEFEAVHEGSGNSYHDFFEHSWGQYLARMCGSTVYNLSRGGMSAKEYCDSFADHMGFWNSRYASEAYIIALGVNDILNQNQEIGSISDIDFDNYNNNKNTFTGYYAKIIQRVKIMFVGNSITLHGVKEDIGWHNPWGMAASSEENDYVHRIVKQLENLGKRVSYCICQVSVAVAEKIRFCLMSERVVRFHF